MQHARSWLTVIGGALICVLLIWFGIELLRLPDDITTIEFFLFGCIALGGGALAVTSSERHIKIAGIVLFGVSLYSYARALGWIEYPWLITTLGVASFIAAGVAAYIAWRAAVAHDPSTKQLNKELPPHDA